MSRPLVCAALLLTGATAFMVADLMAGAPVSTRLRVEVFVNNLTDDAGGGYAINPGPLPTGIGKIETVPDGSRMRS
jgi:hypothetical protein